MKDIIEFTIPYEPRTKKNSSRIVWNKKFNRPQIIPSAEYTKYEKECASYVPSLGEPIGYPVNVKCVYYRQTRRRVDITNLLSATDDILVKYGLLEDDNRDIVASHNGSVVLYDKENPRTEITIEPVENYPQWKGAK